MFTAGVAEIAQGTWFQKVELTFWMLLP